MLDLNLAHFSKRGHVYTNITTLGNSSKWHHRNSIALQKSPGTRLFNSFFRLKTTKTPKILSTIILWLVVAPHTEQTIGKACQCHDIWYHIVASHLVMAITYCDGIHCVSWTRCSEYMEYILWCPTCPTFSIFIKRRKKNEFTIQLCLDLMPWPAVTGPMPAELWQLSVPPLSWQL